MLRAQVETGPASSVWLGEAQRNSGMTEKAALVRESLRALIERESAG
jgi:hypothetical protein